MVKPSIAELSQNNKYNRYTLVIAAAKGARYVIDKENYEKAHPELEQYKAITSGKKNEKFDEKPVKEAINMLYNGEMFIKDAEEAAEVSSEAESTETEAEAEAEEAQDTAEADSEEN